jgi:hypothetical protein
MRVASGSWVILRQYDDFARLLNFSVVEASGSGRVAIELRIDSGGSNELLAINRQDETDGEI